MITFDHVTKKFGPFTAINDLSFTVEPQQAVALWGSNGAGKTTVIKSLLGLLHYTGQIRVAGLDAQRQGRAARKLLGYVPQELAFYDDLSTADTARFFAQLKNTPVQQVAAVLGQVGLAEHLAKPVRALSGGLKQRLALGLALLGDPPILVLDEPTSNLDVATRNTFLHLLDQVKAAGKTIMFTSHRLEEVEQLADRVLVLEHGALKLTCRANELAPRLGLRTQMKLLLAPDLIEGALSVLQRDGFTVRRNGVGVLVDVLADEKAKPIHLLSQANIRVTDFEVE